MMNRSGRGALWLAALALSLSCSTNSTSADGGPLGALTVPTGLRAIASPTALSVELSWDEESAATGYLVFRSAGGAAAQIASTSSAAWLDSTVTPGTAFTYTVRAVGASGTTGDSDAATALTIPGAPQALVATAVGATSLTVSWTEAPGATGGDAVTYVTGHQPAVVAAASGSSFTASNLQPDAAYTFTITARDATGSGPPVMATFSTLPLGDGGTDAGEDAGSDAGDDAGSDAGLDGGDDAGSSGAFALRAYGADSLIVLQWDDQGADSYQVFRAHGGSPGAGSYVQLGSSTVANYADLGSSPNTIIAGDTYSYYVVPLVGGVASPASGIATAPAFGVAARALDVYISDIDAGIVPVDESAADGQQALLTRSVQTYQLIPALPDGGLDSNLDDIVVPYGTSNGYAVFPGVPAAPYLLAGSSPPSSAVMSAAARTLDLAETSAGRAAVASAQTATLSFQLTGLAPWASDDALQAVSWGAADSTYSANSIDSQLADPPAQGSTTLSSGALEFSSLFTSSGLLDGAQGDQLYLLQQADDTSGNTAYSAARAGLATGPLTTPDGANTDIDGGMNSATTGLLNKFNVSAQTSGFHAYASAVNPHAVVGGADAGDSTPVDDGAAALFAQPAFSAQGGYGLSAPSYPPQIAYGDYTYGGFMPRQVSFAPALFAGQFPAPGANPSQDINVVFGAGEAIEYVDPFPGSWEQVLTAYIPFTADEPTPSGATVQITGQMQTQGLLAHYLSEGAMVVNPIVSPVQAPQINGSPAWAAQGHSLSFDSASALAFSWSPSALGSPNLYTVTVWGATDADGLDVDDGPLAVLQTSGTQVALPAGALQPSAAQSPALYYVAFITAIATDVDRLGAGGTAQLLRHDGDVSTADCITSVFAITSAARGARPPRAHGGRAASASSRRRPTR